MLSAALPRSFAPPSIYHQAAGSRWRRRRPISPLSLPAFPQTEQRWLDSLPGFRARRTVAQPLAAWIRKCLHAGKTESLAVRARLAQLCLHLHRPTRSSRHWLLIITPAAPCASRAMLRPPPPRVRSLQRIEAGLSSPITIAPGICLWREKFSAAAKHKALLTRCARKLKDRHRCIGRMPGKRPTFRGGR